MPNENILTIPFTIHELIDKSVSFFPENIFISDDEHTLTYAQFQGYGHDLAKLFESYGLKQNNRVLISIENSTITPLIIYSCSLLGIIAVPISKGYKSDQLDFILDDCMPVLIVTDTLLKIEKSKYLVLSPEQIWDAISFNQEITFSKPHVIDLDYVLLLYTSGSTGNPKAVAISHSNVLSSTESIARYLNIQSTDRIINFNPFNFDYGLYQFLIASARGATLFIKKNFVFKNDVLKFIERLQITVVPFVPSQINSLLQIESLSFPNVRIVTSTGASLQEHSIKILATVFPKATVFAMYGLTECKRATYLEPQKLFAKSESVGQAMPNTRVTVVDNEYNEVEPFQIGQLIIEGRNVMSCYWNNQDQSAKILFRQSFDKPISLLTGDYFYKDDDGDLFFKGRKDDIYKSYGLRISTKDIEKEILKIESIVESAVIGRYDQNGNAYFTAFIVSKGQTPSLDNIISTLKKGLASLYMIPKDFYFEESLPKNSNNKVDYIMLSERLK